MNMRSRVAAFVVALLCTTLAGVHVSAATLPVSGGTHYADGRYIVNVVDGVAPTTVMADHGLDGSDSFVFTEVVNAFSADLTGKKAEEIAADSRVIDVHISQKVQVATTQTTGPTGTYSSPNTYMPWGLDRIDQRTAVVSSDASKQSYSYVHSGVGVKVYILDSGLKGDHPDFAGRVANGWSYRATSESGFTLLSQSMDSCKVNQPSYNYYYSAADHIYDVDEFDQTWTPSDVGTPDNDGHGTHVAGIIGGTIAGVAKGVTLVPVRVLNSCGVGNEETVLLGLNWVATNHVDGQSAVVNMSIGLDGNSALVDDAITSLLERGIVVVAAVGNSGSSTCGSPASTFGVISVGASNYLDKEPNWSNYGNCVDIFAPGSFVLSASHMRINDSEYRVLSGTSMAAPHVAGVAAIALETHPQIQTDPLLINQDIYGRKIGRTLFIWNWIKTRATTNSIAYYDMSRTQQTPNRLLNLSAPIAPINVAVNSSTGLVSWSELADQEGKFTAANKNDVTDPFRNMSFNDISYTVLASPGNLSCSTTSTSCAISGFEVGNAYSIVVRANNLVGDSPNSVPVSLVLPFAAPSAVTALPSNQSVVLTWSAVAPNISYVVTETKTGATCIAVELTCKFGGLKNGIDYTFSVVSKSSSGVVSSTPTLITARPGFIVKQTVVATKSKTSLTKIMTTPSKGAKRWSETGKCSIAKGRLVAPKVATVCKVTLRVAKAGKYPAMKATVNVTVS